jgi:hypothetical protein
MNTAQHVMRNEDKMTNDEINSLIQARIIKPENQVKLYQDCSHSPPGEIAVKHNEGTGAKHDHGKADMSLLSSIALLKVAQVMTFGKKKYSANNWRGGFVWTRPLAACLRHVFAYLGGEDKDPETGISHLAHAVCCLLFVLEFEETHKELDDRYRNTK